VIFAAKRIYYSDIDRVVARGALGGLLISRRKLRPRFSASWVRLGVRSGWEVLDEYHLTGNRIRVFGMPGSVEDLYHVLPLEYELPMEQVRLIEAVRQSIQGSPPRDLILDDPTGIRARVLSMAIEMVQQEARTRKISLGRSRKDEARRVEELAGVVTKYTAGLGVVETFLDDPAINDVFIDAPVESNPVYVNMTPRNGRSSGRCRTNVLVGEQDASALLSRFRLLSGTPFSEAHPLLEMDLHAYSTRITVIGPPLSPEGVSFTLRRHATDPWTLPRFVRNGMLSPYAAGILSLLIDGQSTILVAGPRGAGKTSLLSALILEFPASQRILTIEDTLELPYSAFQDLGLKVQPLHVASGLLSDRGGGGMTADDALRVSLRLGESAIVLGEVRGKEAKTLYEAMRAGTAGSAVLGTLHGDSARSVYERVVHDMGIPSKAFDATDIIVVCGLTRPGGSQRRKRRVVEVSELIKGTEGEFRTLLRYDQGSDALLPTEEFRKEGSDRLRAIAGSWGMDHKDMLDQILLRANARSRLVELSESRGDELLSGRSVVRANSLLLSALDEHGSGKALDIWERMI